MHTEIRKEAARVWDGVVDSAFGETCDDGNDNENDSCPSGPNGSCQFATCGDGFVGIRMEDWRSVSPAH